MSGLTVLGSGKGGVGKTFLAVSLAHALGRRGRRVLLVDADLGLANVDVQLGLEPGIPLGRAIRAGLDLRALIRHDGATGIAVLGAGGSPESLAGLGDAGLGRAIAAIAATAGRFDDVLVDLPSGIGRVARLFAEQARRLVVVGNDEPTTLTDNYAFIKLTRATAARRYFLANGVADAAEGRRAHGTLARACRRFLDLDCAHLGTVRQDPRVPEAIRRQMPLLDRSPQTASAGDIEAVARELAGRTDAVFA